MKRVIFAVLIGITIYTSKAKEPTWLIKTRFLALAFKGEPNLYLEKINWKKRRGWEIGLQFHQPINLIAGIGLASRYPVGFTSGGEYGFASVTPFYDFNHAGWTNSISYKFYSKNYKRFLSTQVEYTYKQLKNIHYSDYDPGPVTQRPHYYYNANHYTKRIGMFISVGSNYDLKKRKSIMEYGIGAGLLFKLDDLVILNYGGATLQGGSIYQSPNLKKDIESGNITNGLNGFSILPMFRFYWKCGLSW